MAQQKKFEEVTLYNFTSLRSPQNREKEDEEMKIDFIFCDIIETKSAISAIKKVQHVEDYDELNKDGNIKSIVDIGKKINQYRYKEIDNKEILNDVSKIKITEDDTLKIKQIAWRSLVYVTKYGGELKFKEALMNIIRIFHIKGNNKLDYNKKNNEGKTIIERLLDAQVVIPKELFPKEETFFFGEKIKQYQIDPKIIKQVKTEHEISKLIFEINNFELDAAIQTKFSNDLTYLQGVKSVLDRKKTSIDIFKSPFFASLLLNIKASKEKLGVLILNFDNNYFQNDKQIISANFTIMENDIHLSWLKDNTYNSSEVLFNLTSEILTKINDLTLIDILLKVEITLKDESIYSFETILKRQKLEDDRIKIIEYSNNGEIIISDGKDYYGQAFAPSGYGVKQLGILEYRKVTSTISRYVPAEVSKIENVMASEYRELSTVKELIKEVTDFESSETSNEKENETVSTDRFQMQNEISKIFEQQNKSSFDTNASYNGGTTSLDMSYGTSTVNSKNESNKQAVTNAKEVTNKAVEKIFTKVRKERTVKVTERHTESNKHGFDNRGNDKHVSGVYRHINAVYKNQIYNYGRRLLYEFAIPEPALFHRIAIDNQIDWVEKLQKIKRPNNPKDYINDFTEITQDSQLKIETLSGIKFDDIIIFQSEKHLFNEYGGGGTQAPVINYNIPDGYELNNYSIVFDPVPNGWTYAGAVEFLTRAGDTPTFNIFIENINITSLTYTGNDMILPSTLLQENVQIRIPNNGQFSIKVVAHQVEKFFAHVLVIYKITDSAYSKWQRIQYDKIIEKYGIDFNNYKNEIAKLFEENPIIDKYQEEDKEYIQHITLRKHCISYLISDDPKNSNRHFGQDMFMKNTRNDLINLKILMNSQLNEYTAFARFLEQAFDWNMMSYSYYPFYWAKDTEWKVMYNLYDIEPSFKKFLQAGMARVVVSVKPGFEKAIMQYMLTGKIWEGGEVPTYGSSMFLSIAAEMKESADYKIEDTWETVLPTNLIALQSSGIAINQEGLPNLENNQDLGEMVDNPHKLPKRKKFLGLF